jgi:integrase/recombinase XerC
MPIKSFLEYILFEKKYSQLTITAYQNDLRSFQEFCLSTYENNDIVNVNYAQIRSWIVILVDSGVTNRTINRKISALKSFYKFLQKTKQIDISPLLKHQSLKTSKRIQVPFSEKEIEDIFTINNSAIEFESVRDKLIVELLYATGMRRSELINLKLADVNLGNQTIKVLGKRNKERYIPLLQTVINSLSKYVELRSEIKTIQPFLIITKKGKKTYDTLVYRIINNYFSSVSSKVKKSPHVIRHSFATHLLNNGADLNSVKELLGHSSLASTQVYTHSSMGKLKEVYNLAHPRSDKN